MAAFLVSLFFVYVFFSCAFRIVQKIESKHKILFDSFAFAKRSGRTLGKAYKASYNTTCCKWQVASELKAKPKEKQAEAREEKRKEKAKQSKKSHEQRARSCRSCSEAQHFVA